MLVRASCSSEEECSQHFAFASVHKIQTRWRQGENWIDIVFICMFLEWTVCPENVQIIPLTDWVIRGAKWSIQQGSSCSLFSRRLMKAEFLLQSFHQEADVSSSGMGKDVQPLTLSSQHLFCQAQYCPLSKVPLRVFLERLS